MFNVLFCILQVFITVVLSFLQKRAKRLGIDNRLPFLKGRFAIVVWVNYNRDIQIQCGNSLNETWNLGSYLWMSYWHCVTTASQAAGYYRQPQ